MTRVPERADFLRGARHSAPFILVVVPFAMLFGVVGTEAGLNIAQVMGFSVLVIAGAAQFTAVQLMTENAPTIMVLFGALTVNLRVAMYSASLTPHLGAEPLWKRALIGYVLVDQSYTAAILEYERRPDMTVKQKSAYYLGVMAVITPLWYACTLIGALLGQSVPAGLGLDFALPITFLAMVAPALRTVPHLASAFVSLVLGLALAGLPFSLGLPVAAFVAMIAGAQLELWMARRPT